MLPVEGLINEGHVLWAAAAEDDGVDGDTLDVLEFGGDGGTLGGGGGKARVRVGSGGLGVARPLLAVPVDDLTSGGILGQALPPDVTVLSLGNVGEDGVLVTGGQGIRVGLGGGAGGHTEEAVLGVDGVQLAVVTKAHPGNVVTDTLELPAWEGGTHHGEVSLATRGGEGSGHVELLALGIGQTKNLEKKGKKKSFRFRFLAKERKPLTSMCSASQPSSRPRTEAMRRAKHFFPRRELPP